MFVISNEMLISGITGFLVMILILWLMRRPPEEINNFHDLNNLPMTLETSGIQIIVSYTKEREWRWYSSRFSMERDLFETSGEAMRDAISYCKKFTSSENKG